MDMNWEIFDGKEGGPRFDIALTKGSGNIGWIPQAKYLSFSIVNARLYLIPISRPVKSSSGK